MSNWTAEEQAEHRQQWIVALRSGNYKQGKGALRNSNEYCCLGVACDISSLGEWGDDREFSKQYIVSNNRPNAGNLPVTVMDWLGLCTQDGTIDSDNTLATMNDRGGKNFEDIANLIEQGKVPVQGQFDG